MNNATDNTAPIDDARENETIEPEIENLRLVLEQEEAADQAEQPGAESSTGDQAREGEYIAAGDRFDNNVRMLSQAIETVFRTISLLKNREHWKVTEEEARNAAVPTAQLIRKYFGDIDIGPELSFALEFSVLIGVRMLADQELDAQARRPAREGE